MNLYKKRPILLAIIITALVTYYGTTAMTIISDNTSKLVKAEKVIRNHYVNTLSDEQLKKLEDSAIDAMVSSLNDPYSYYMNTDRLSEYVEESKEEYVGLGMSITFNEELDKIVVTAPYDNSPAQKAGIAPGDVITQVDDITVTSDTYNDVLDHIKSNGAKPGEEVVIKLERNGEPMTLTVIRDIIPIQSISSKMLENNMGYIRISQFIESTDKDFNSALDSLLNDGMKGLIIDLRNNPGGYATTVINITDRLEGEGLIAYSMDNNGRKTEYKSDKISLDIPMEVLINQGTASASELLAGSLKAHELAEIVGMKSYGKAVGQSVHPISGSSAVYLTNSRYYTPLGDCIDGIGITPDIELDMDIDKIIRIGNLDVNEDDQLLCAINSLKEKIN